MLMLNAMHRSIAGLLETYGQGAIFRTVSCASMMRPSHLTHLTLFFSRHVAYVTGGLMALINFNFPFSPSFPTIGMCPSGWKGTFVCEPDKTKALEMYKAYKAGKKTEVSVSISH